MKSSKKAKKTFVLQQDHSDCGIACLASICKFYGGASRFENLRDWSGTSKQGTTLLGLYQAAIQLNFNADAFEAELENLFELQEPVILHLNLENGLQHYVVYYGIENEKIIIGDPAKGILFFSKEKLERVWKSKTLLKLHPSQQFEIHKQSNKKQWNWIKKLVTDDVQILSVCIFLGVLIAGLSLAVSVFNQKLIDDILPNKNPRQIGIAIALLALLLISNTLLLTLRKQFLLQQSKDFNIRIIHSFFNKLLQLPKRFFDNRRSGDFIARLNDSARIQQFLSKVVGNFTIEILILLVSIFVLFFYSKIHALMGILFLPIYASILFYYNKKIVQSQQQVMENYAHNESFYINSLNGIESIQNSNKSNYFSDQNLRIYSKFQDKIFQLGKISIRLGLLSDLLGTAFLACIISLGAYHVMKDIISIGALIAIIGISTRISPALNNIIAMIIQVQEAKIAFHRLYEMVSIPENKKDTKNFNDNIETIVVNNISFRFAGRSLLLENLNLSIQKGQIVALLGESGSGKSTLAAILQNFYPHESGQIHINHSDLNTINTKSWRNKIGSIPQQIHIFNQNLAFNILLEDINEKNYQILELFCKKWGFDYFFNQLPQGILTKVGEDGINLSGGQKQILAFARVLYRNPEFIILDEATSAMDRESEKFIFSILHRIKKEKAILFITHRIHILKNLVDQIYILEDKKIEHFGTHEDLLTTQNPYSKFWGELFTEINIS